MPCLTITSPYWFSHEPSTTNSQKSCAAGARTLLAQAVEAEVASFLAKHEDLTTEDGHRRVVRHGHLPKREVMTGIGPVTVRQRPCGAWLRHDVCVIERQRLISRRQSCRPTS